MLVIFFDGICLIEEDVSPTITGNFNCDEGGVLTQEWTHEDGCGYTVYMLRYITVLPDLPSIVIDKTDIYVEGNIITPIGSSSSSTTSVIKVDKKVVYISSVVNISSFEVGMDGQEITIIGASGASIELGSATNIVLSLNNSSTILEENDVIKFVYISQLGKWVQMSYVNN